MPKKTVINPYNVLLIDYTELLQERVSQPALDELYELNLIEGGLSLKDKTTNRVIVHSLINALCDYIIENRGCQSRPVFLINKLQLSNIELFEYADKDDMIKFIDRTNNKLKKLIRINYFETEHTYETFVDRINSDGDCIELLLESINSTSSYNLHQLYRYVTDNGMLSIKRKFFDDIKYKQVLI